MSDDGPKPTSDKPKTNPWIWIIYTLVVLLLGFYYLLFVWGRSHRA